MKIVIDGTGLIWSKLVELLRGHGHAAAAAPDTSVATLTGRTSHVHRREGQAVPRGRRLTTVANERGPS